MTITKAITFNLWDTMIADETDEPRREDLAWALGIDDDILRPGIR